MRHYRVESLGAELDIKVADKYAYLSLTRKGQKRQKVVLKQELLRVNAEQFSDAELIEVIKQEFWNED